MNRRRTSRKLRSNSRRRTSVRRNTGGKWRIFASQPAPYHTKPDYAWARTRYEGDSLEDVMAVARTRYERRSWEVDEARRRVNVFTQPHHVGQTSGDMDDLYRKPYRKTKLRSNSRRRTSVRRNHHLPIGGKLEIALEKPTSAYEGYTYRVLADRMENLPAPFIDVYLLQRTDGGRFALGFKRGGGVVLQTASGRSFPVASVSLR